MKSWSFMVPNFIPTSTNVLLGMHPMKRGRVKNGDMALIAHYFREAEIPKALGKRRVDLALTTGPRGGILDRDNACKVLADGLVKCGALLDDKPGLLEWGTYSCVRGPARMTVITLHEVE